MTRYDKLWHSVDGPGLPPHVDGGSVKARVNAVLDAGQRERKMDMKQRFCTVLAIAAAILAITGTALAAAVNWDALSAHFKGDIAPGQQYLDNEVLTVSDENYTFTVESSAADESCVYLVVSIAAISDEAKEFLYSSGFISMDTFGASTLSEREASEDDWASGDGTPLQITGLGSRELKSEEENCRRFALNVRTRCAVGTLYVRCGYMEAGKEIEISVRPAPSVTVKINASGTGVLDFRPASAITSDSLTIREITLTPFTCHIKLKRSSVDIEPRILLRMKDGAVMTQSQVMTGTDGSTNERSYRFYEVQDLDSISSIIVFDREYPLDGSPSAPVEHDPMLDPFTVTRMDFLEEGSGYSIPVQELTEKLGGTFRQDLGTGEAVCVYRGVTIRLRAGDRTALVDGKAVEMLYAPAIQNGILAAHHHVFRDSWGIQGVVLRERIRQDGDGEEIVWHDWYIIP